MTAYKMFNKILNSYILIIDANAITYTELEALLYQMQEDIEQAQELGEIDQKTKENHLFIRMSMIDRYAARKLAE